MMTIQRNLINAITADHHALEAMLDKLHHQVGVHHRRRLADRVVVELRRHFAVEKRRLYPFAGQTLPDGYQKVAELEDQDDIERVMDRLEMLDPKTEEFEATLLLLTIDLRHHVTTHEVHLLPALQG